MRKIKKLNMQETFNKVARHLLTQNKRAVAADSSSCQYKAANGLQCAAGCLIPDELYDEKIESGVVDYDGDNFNRPKFFRRLVTSLDFLKQLQDIHDADDVRDWPRELARLAKNKRLKMPAILKRALKAEYSK